MTRQEYIHLSKTEFKEKYGYPKFFYYNQKMKFWKSVIDEMKEKRPGIKILLHHFILNDSNYEKWECIPMYLDEHSAFHSRNKTQEWIEKVRNKNIGRKFGPEFRLKKSIAAKNRSPETKAKFSALRKGKWTISNGEIVAYINPGERIPDGWYRGMTKRAKRKRGERAKLANSIARTNKNRWTNIKTGRCKYFDKEIYPGPDYIPWQKPKNRAKLIKASL